MVVFHGFLYVYQAGWIFQPWCEEVMPTAMEKYLGLPCQTKPKISDSIPTIIRHF
jgi:hypothetical protein